MPVWPVPMDSPWFIVRLVLPGGACPGLSAATYRFVEKPFLRRKARLVTAG